MRKTFLRLSIDRYGRLAVARVIVENQDAGLELLKQGLCWVYEKYVAQASAEIQISYWAAQAAAQSDRLGLWQDTDPVPPWDWRKGKRATLGFELVGFAFDWVLFNNCCVYRPPPRRYPAAGETCPKNNGLACGLTGSPVPLWKWRLRQMTDVTLAT